jgi:hypothetical protein
VETISCFRTVARSRCAAFDKVAKTWGVFRCSDVRESESNEESVPLVGRRLAASV